jgi:HK97 family phage portal protein
MRIGPYIFFERKSLSNPTEEEYAIFTGGGTAAVPLNVALSVPGVQSAIRVISEAAASLDILVEKFDGESWIPAPEHPVAKLLADQPNDWTSTFDLIRDLLSSALVYDKGGLAYCNRINGEVREIVRYEVANFNVDWSGDGRQEPSFKINNVPMASGDIIHIRSPFSKCPLNLATDAIGTSKQLEAYAYQFFKKAARPGGIIKFPKGVGEGAVGKMKAAWQAAFGGSDNAGGTPVLYDGGEFIPLTMNSTDAQFLEMRKFQITEVARAFRVPPQMLYELDRATWSNSEQMGREFLTYSLEPWLLTLEGAMRRGLFTDEERATHRIRFDRDDLTRADLTARSTAIASLIASRVLNPNEGRDWLGLPPRDGGEEYANPNTGSNQPGAAAPQPAKVAANAA